MTFKYYKAAADIDSYDFDKKKSLISNISLYLKATAFNALEDKINCKM